MTTPLLARFKRANVGQGVAMGLSNSFLSLGRILGPMWAGPAFDLSFNYPYLSGSLILFIGFLVSLVRVSQTRGEAASAGLWQAVEDSTR